MSGACRMHERDEKCVQNLSENLKGKKSLVRPKHRWDLTQSHILQGVKKVVKDRGVQITARR
jgi:hypothetical protein